MTTAAIKLSVAVSILCSGCVAGPGGSNNAANRAVAGIAIGALLGGVAGQAVGSNAFDGAAAGAIVGGALGAAVNPNYVFRRDTKGYCYLVDAGGKPVFDAKGNVVYDYSRRC